MNEIIQMAEGNPGAMSFLMQLVSKDHILKAVPIVQTLKEAKIKGADLYVLWSDLCLKDFDMVLKLCEKCPQDKLIDACSRQDYSGREIVKEYLS